MQSHRIAARRERFTLDSQQIQANLKGIPTRKISNHPGQPHANGHFKVRTIESILDGTDLNHDLHRHDFFFILALKRGCGKHEIDFRTYDLVDNSLFIIRPGQVHRLTLKSASTGFLLEFDAAFYHPGNKMAITRALKAAAIQYCRFEKSRFARLLDLFACILREFTAKPEGYIDMINANLDILFIEFVRQGSSVAQMRKDFNPYVNDRFEEFKQLLETRFTTQRKVSAYASLLNLSVFQLNAITKEVTGKPVSELINDQVILEAKRLLMATPAQVKEIANHLGYDDISYFIRFFKKNTGCSPETFRKNFA